MIRFGIVSIWDFLDLGFWIADFGFNGKAHGAKGTALEVSEISELSACTLCAIASSIEHRVTSNQ